MKIAYCAYCSKLSTGVTKKIKDQAKALKEYCPIMDLFLLHPEEIHLSNKFSNFPLPKSVTSFLKRKKGFSELQGHLAKRNYDLIYLRYPFSDPSAFSFISQIHCPVVVEFQTKELEELHSLGLLLPYWIEKVFAGFFRRKCSGIVGVTEEIREYQVSLSKSSNIPSLFLGNGINVGAIPLRNAPQKFDSLEVLFVGTLSNWHGIDRFLKGMVEKNSNCPITLNIVGHGSAIAPLKRWVSENNIHDKVIFHGFKTGKGLDEMFDKCHIAVGSLGIHRKGLQETSDLKSREYCARGIPFFSSAFDADFSENLPFRLKVPADDSPIDMEQVMDFAKKVLADREHPQIMREYALSNLDWNIKMRKLKGFFEEILKRQVGK